MFVLERFLCEFQCEFHFDQSYLGLCGITRLAAADGPRHRVALETAVLVALNDQVLLVDRHNVHPIYPTL